MRNIHASLTPRRIPKVWGKTARHWQVDVCPLGVKEQNPIPPIQGQREMVSTDMIHRRGCIKCISSEMKFNHPITQIEDQPLRSEACPTTAIVPALITTKCRTWWHSSSQTQLRY